MSKPKKTKYWLTVTMVSGVQFEFKAVDIDNSLGKILCTIDDVWKGQAGDGFVQFGGQYMRASQIAAYKLRKRWL